MRTRYKIQQIIILIFLTAFFLFMALYATNGWAKWLIIVLDIFMVYRLVVYYKKCPVVYFDNENITTKSFFNNKTYEWSELIEVNLSIKETGVLMGAFKYEATTLKFNNGERIILWNDTYANLNEIRKLIVEKAKDKVKDAIPEIRKSALQFLGTKKYEGNPFITANTLTIILSIIYLTFLTPNDIFNKPLVLLTYIPVMLIFVGLGLQMNYFIIDHDSFIIKNHYYPWKKKILSLNDILEMDIEQPNKRSKSLRILTKDYQSKLYGAGSLRQKHWDELKQDLTDIGITIRND